jgi:hypothetical protein
LIASCTFLLTKKHSNKLQVAAALALFAVVPSLAAQAISTHIDQAPLPALPLFQSASLPFQLATNTTPDLPDSPGALLSSSSYDPQNSGQTQPEPQPGQPSTSIKPPEVERHWYRLGTGDADRASHMASTTDKYILPGQLAPKLTTGDKVEFGLIHGVSAYGFLGWFVSSGYSHVINTSPNYGTDSGAYGERLGAAALRGYSTEVLKDSVMANVFHQDPRYYKMGPSHNVVTRAAYAVSRVLVTRDDDGGLAPNYSLISGNLLGAALTNAYYPDVNRGFGQTAKTFGSAMYGSAFSYFASEFINGALEAAHLGTSSK